MNKWINKQVTTCTIIQMSKTNKNKFRFEFIKHFIVAPLFFTISKCSIVLNKTSNKSIKWSVMWSNWRNQKTHSTSARALYPCRRRMCFNVAISNACNTAFAISSTALTDCLQLLLILPPEKISKHSFSLDLLILLSWCKVPVHRSLSYYP